MLFPPSHRSVFNRHTTRSLSNASGGEIHSKVFAGDGTANHPWEQRSNARNLGTELADAERLFLRAPEQGEIDPVGETHHGEVGRQAAFRDRLDDSRR